MQNSILAHIATNFISEYENVANSSICYLLNEYSAAQDALKGILGVESVPTRYLTEMSTDSNGRPDVTGLDADGGKSVIIEGKFWANLTDNQPSNYLKEIKDEGKILFLAPDKRCNSLKIELAERAGGFSEKLVLCSWSSFISLIEIENNKNHNHQLASDLSQINELCQKMDTEGMPPLSASDLDPMAGRITANFSDVIDECNDILRKWEHSDFKGLNTTSSKYGHGFYFRGYNLGCKLHFDSNKWFTRDNHTPIWLHVGDGATSRFDELEIINHYLNEYDSGNSFEHDFGIKLDAGMDKNQIVDHIVKETKKVLKFLNEKVENG